MSLETEVQSAGERRGKGGGHLSQLFSYPLDLCVTQPMGAAIERAAMARGVRKAQIVRECLAACLMNGGNHV